MEQAFVEMVDEQQHIIHKVCRMYRDTREDQEDLFQDIVYQLWKSYPSFRGDSAPGTWMYRIALNTAIAVYRKNKLRLQYPEKLPEHRYPETNARNIENEDRLYQALRQLDDAEKAIITLYLDDLPYKDIAAVTGISENNVAVRINRIKNKLKKLFQ